VFSGGKAQMESDLRYYLRRAAAEQTAASRALTPQARDRRLMLAEQFAARAREIMNLPENLAAE
jgi:hypothetical protein